MATTCRHFVAMRAGRITIHDLTIHDLTIHDLTIHDLTIHHAHGYNLSPLRGYEGGSQSSPAGAKCCSPGRQRRQPHQPGELAKNGSTSTEGATGIHAPRVTDCPVIAQPTDIPIQTVALLGAHAAESAQAELCSMNSRQPSICSRVSEFSRVRSCLSIDSDPLT